jgi:TAT (twin-arginine translocation) pathway-exported protein
MPSRRDFLQTGAAAAAALTGAASVLNAGPILARDARSVEVPGPKAASEVQVPKMKFFDVEISRMVLGVNPFCGFAHYNNNYSGAMKEWYTPERVSAVMHECAAYGINAFNYAPYDPFPQDWTRFLGEGGKMHLIMQVVGAEETEGFAKNLKPLAMHRQGEVVDIAYREGKMNEIRDWCKKVRDLGIIVGVGTHKPEVIAQVEDEGWDVDFYAGCVYNRTRTREEWKKILNGEIMEMEREIYVQSDPPRMYSVMRETKKPCFAFKILAAGRVDDGAIEQAFRTAFSSIKPNDGVFVGMFPRAKDEVRQNAEIVHRILQA